MRFLPVAALVAVASLASASTSSAFGLPSLRSERGLVDGSIVQPSGSGILGSTRSLASDILESVGGGGRRRRSGRIANHNNNNNNNNKSDGNNFARKRMVRRSRSRRSSSDNRDDYQEQQGMTGKGKGKDEAASIERSSEQRDAVERRASSSSSSTCKSDTISPKTKTTLVNAGYWADWTASTLPPENIDFTKFDFINFAFALPTVDFDLSFNSEASKSLLKRLVTAAHNGDTKVALSIGGWGGSTYFSTAVRTNSSRATFISNIKKIYSTYSLDGIDIDWEYPGQSTEGSQYDAMDAKNLQSFFQELRVALPDAMLSAAVTHRPFIGSKGVPITNVKRSAEALDYILIMNYDVWGSSSVPGSNSPLANLCGNSTMPSASAAAGVKAWSAAGMPREKILLGIPAYGYINTSTKKTLQTRKVPIQEAALAHRDWRSRKLTTPPASGSSDAPSGKVGRYDARHLKSRSSSSSSSSGDASHLDRRGVTLTSSDGSTYSGQINFKAIVDQGALVKDSSGLYDEAGGFIKYWDDCSDTPYLSNGNIVVTYDDTSSIWDKGAFAAKAGIAGLNMWSLDGDNNWDLTKAAIAGMRSGYASLSS